MDSQRRITVPPDKTADSGARKIPPSSMCISMLKCCTAIRIGALVALIEVQMAVKQTVIEISSEKVGSS